MTEKAKPSLSRLTSLYNELYFSGAGGWMARKHNNLDTSWFDLKNYEALKTMSIEGWIQQLDLRQLFHKEVDFYINHPEHKTDFMSVMVNELKAGVFDLPSNQDHIFFTHNRKAKAVLNGNPFSTVVVNSLTSGGLWKIANNDDLSIVATKQRSFLYIVISIQTWRKYLVSHMILILSNIQLLILIPIN